MIVCSCEKSDTTFNEFDFNGIKVYNDTLASGENSNIKITAGKDRLYMTYGWGTAFWPYVNGMVVTGTSELTGTIMSTDLNGNLLWQKKLPPGLSTTSPLELNDGSCTITAANLWAYSNKVDPKTIYLFHFSRNGQQLSIDSFILPASVSSDYNILSLDIVESYSGNILMYGTTTDFSPGGTKGFVLEYSIGQGILWSKNLECKVPLPGAAPTTTIHNCIQTIDGGYVFLGTFDSDPSIGDINFAKTILIKTDANGDTLWTRGFDYFYMAPPTTAPIPGNIIQLSNGNFRFCTNDNTDNDYMKFRSHIYEVNSTGDSMKAYIIHESENRYCPVIIDNNGSTLALVNSYPVFLVPAFSPVFNQINSHCYSFDSELKLLSETKFQTQRSDFFTAGCRMKDGRIAFFGLFETSNYRTYVPTLMIR